MKEVELERAFVSVICVCAVGDEERGEREVSRVTEKDSLIVCFCLELISNTAILVLVMILSGPVLSFR